MNKRTTLALIGLISVGIFAGLARHGWTHRYGSPETFEIQTPRVLAVPFQPRSLNLDPGDVHDEVWRDVPGLDVPLMPQMTQQPWTAGLIPVVRVQAFHDDSDIYVRLVWQDESPNRTLSVDSFADACAVAIPLDTAAPTQSIMMGFSSPVNIWHWQAHRGAGSPHGATAGQAMHADYTYPFEDQETLPVSRIPIEGAVTDLLAGRAGSLTPKGRQIVQGQAHWNDGTWSVVFKRSLRTEDAQQDAQLGWGRFSASFAVWEGSQGDRGSRKSMSDWVTLDIQAKEDKSKIRNPKSETSTNGNKEAMIETALAGAAPAFGSLRFWILNLFRISDLDIRIADPGILASAEPQPQLINVLAQRFSYTPNRISVRKGQRITLRLESLDVLHGLYLDGYGIDIKARPGQVGQATFTADRPGRFSFRCSETCGEFHPYMVGFFEVTPNTRFVLFAGATGAMFLVILFARSNAVRRYLMPSRTHYKREKEDGK
jgi:heme/copper-type cytochrome/quinol oxidase subunit 2